jgi:NAD(P)-dependent dehydrogenase (short-subunit alcohol dehydrogenase family)
MTPSGGRPVAVVTGGAKRLGHHLCEDLAAAGYHVVVCYRHSLSEAQTLVNGIVERGGSARSLCVDVAHSSSVGSAFSTIAEHEGRIDLLINNVGNYDPRPVDAMTVEGWDATIAANLSGPFYCVHAALPLMPDGSLIISIGMAGLDGIRANPIATDYYVSKTGLLSLTRSLAVSLGPRRIRVNMVSPGQLDNSIDLPDATTLPQMIPLGRAGALQDIAGAVRYLIGADYVTGVNIDVAGGYRL